MVMAGNAIVSEGCQPVFRIVDWWSHSVKLIGDLSTEFKLQASCALILRHNETLSIGSTPVTASFAFDDSINSDPKFRNNALRFAKTHVVKETGF